MKESPHPLLKLCSNLFGILFALCVIVIIASLGKFLYFPSKTKAVLPEFTPEDRFSKTIANPLGKGHFHILDQNAYHDEDKVSLCLRCHGNFCHAESKELRSFYNMHTFYLACETCHIRKREGETITFKWLDNTTGQEVKELQGTDGSYGAKIIPVKDNTQRLDRFPKEQLALDYMKNKERYTEEEKKNIQAQLMEHLSKEAVTCKECHQREGYLNFASLGYSKERIMQLSQLEIIKLIEEYKEFFIPTIFDPSAGRRFGNQSKRP